MSTIHSQYTAQAQGANLYGSHSLQPKPAAPVTATFIKTLQQIPEAQWQNINSKRIALNPNPFGPALRKSTFIDAIFGTPDQQKIYTAHLHSAEAALNHNLSVVKRMSESSQKFLEFTDEDLAHYNRAYNMVTLTERGPIASKLAHVHALRHLPADLFQQLILNNAQREIQVEKDHATQAIFFCREGIEFYQSRVSQVYDFAKTRLEEYQKRERKDTKVLSALNHLKVSLDNLSQSIQAAKNAGYYFNHRDGTATGAKKSAYTLLKGMEDDSKSLESILKQIHSLEDLRAYPEMTKALKADLNILADLYFLQATEYERLSTLFIATDTNQKKGGLIEIKSAEECILYALHSYSAAKKLLKEMQTQLEVAEGRMIAKMHLQSTKTGECDIVLNEKDKDVVALRANQKLISITLSSVETALKRLDTLAAVPVQAPKPLVEIPPKKEVNPPTLTELNQQAQFYISSNDSAKALETYKMIYKRTGNPDLLLTLGQLSQAVHQTKQALYYYTESLKKDPNNQQVIKLIAQLQS